MDKIFSMPAYCRDEVKDALAFISRHEFKHNPEHSSDVVLSYESNNYVLQFKYLLDINCKPTDMVVCHIFDVETHNNIEFTLTSSQLIFAQFMEEYND